MLYSPVRTRVTEAYLTAEEKAFKAHLASVLVWYDDDQDDPANCTLLVHNGHRYWYVAGATPKYKWGNTSALAPGRMIEYLDLYDQARAVGPAALQLPADMNEIARAHAIDTYYKNQALMAQAVAVAANWRHGNFDIHGFIGRGMIPSLEIF